MMGRFDGNGWLGVKVEVGGGGGMSSLGEGSWNVRLSSDWPLFRDLSWNMADLPCLQKFVTWENWCWAKHWAVGVHWAGAILVLVQAGPGLVLGEGPSPTPQSPLWAVSATS